LTTLLAKPRFDVLLAARERLGSPEAARNESAHGLVDAADFIAG
jgi:hypothetical protein